jgi:hypothetical protein
MPLQLSKVHEYKRINDGSHAVLIRTSPVIRLSRKVEGQDQLIVYIQNGQFWTEDGKELPKEKWPKWLPEELAKLTDEAKAEVGLKVPDAKAKNE